MLNENVNVTFYLKQLSEPLSQSVAPITGWQQHEKYLRQHRWLCRYYILQDFEDFPPSQYITIIAVCLGGTT